MNPLQLRMSHVLYVAPALTLMLGFTLRSTAMLNHDVAWFMIAAGRMLAGGTYARDFFDMNMPLAVAIYIPPYLFTSVLHWSMDLAINVWTGLLIAQSVWLGLRVLLAWPGFPINAATIPLWATWLLAGMLFLPGYNFGQREHLMVILGLPFLFMAGNSAAVGTLGRPLRFYITLLAAIGFFLKPHFAALPFLLLLQRAYGERSWAFLRAPEALTLCGAAIANAIFVVLCYPDWFICMRWAIDLYGAYRNPTWSMVLAPMPVRLSAVCLSTQLILAAFDRKCWNSAWPLLLGCVYGFAVYFAQFNDWAYHFFPAYFFAFIAQGVVLAVYLQQRPQLPRKALQVLAIGGACAAACAAAVTVERMPTRLNLRHVPEAFAHAQPGDYVFGFTVEVTPLFPTVPLLGLQWASRYSPLWPLGKLLTTQEGDDSRLQPYKEALVESVIEDFDRYRPRWVLVDRRHFQGTPENLDILGMFLANPRFAVIWSGYSLSGPVYYPPGYYSYDLYVRNTAPSARQ